MPRCRHIYHRMRLHLLHFIGHFNALPVALAFKIISITAEADQYLHGAAYHVIAAIKVNAFTDIYLNAARNSRAGRVTPLR